MKRTASLIGILWLGLWSQAFGIDLTPRYIDTFVDGATFHRLFFVYGEQKIGLRVDRETKVEAGGGGVVFHFAKFPDANLLIKHSPLTADEPYEGVGLDRYREAAHRLLPPGVKSVKTLEETPNPISINRWRSFRFVYSFETPEAMTMKSITFLTLDADEQLVLITSAREKDFREATERSWQIIRSWQPLLPGDEVPPKAN